MSTRIKNTWFEFVKPRKYPRNPELMRTRAKRFQTMPQFMFRIDEILVLECKTVLKAYYGGYIRAGITLVKEGVYFGLHGLYWSCVYQICDLVGWTKLVPWEPGSDVKIRHNRDCSPNCQNIDCIHKYIPRWYRKLTGIRDDD